MYDGYEQETLQQRTQVLEEYQTAVKTSISKRRNIERLKASNNIRPERVDEALEDMEEVSQSVLGSHNRMNMTKTRPPSSLGHKD